MSTKAQAILDNRIKVHISVQLSRKVYNKMLPWKQCCHRYLYGHVAMETIAEPVAIGILYYTVEPSLSEHCGDKNLF